METQPKQKKPKIQQESLFNRPGLSRIFPTLNNDVFWIPHQQKKPQVSKNQRPGQKKQSQQQQSQQQLPQQKKPQVVSKNQRPGQKKQSQQLQYWGESYSQQQSQKLQSWEESRRQQKQRRIRESFIDFKNYCLLVLPEKEKNNDSLYNELLRHFNEERFHGTDACGIDWWCIPLFPLKPGNEVLLRSLKNLLCAVYIEHKHKKSDHTGEKEEETFVLLRQTIALLQVTLGERMMDLMILYEIDCCGMNLLEPNVSEYGYGYISKECIGHLLLAFSGKEYAMSMTAWERKMLKVKPEINVQVQEHALILKNPSLPRKPATGHLAMRMHSFAAEKINKPFVVCNPLKKMEQIMNAQVQKAKITGKEILYVEPHLFPVKNPCVVFGSTVQFVNSDDLKGLWRSFVCQRQQQKKKQG